MFWKDSIFKKIALEYDLFSIYFFFSKISCYSLDRKWKMIFLKKNTWKYDIFLKCSEKRVFSNKSHRNMIILIVLSGKMIFPFPESMILIFRRKMKDDISQKNTWKYDVFSNVLKRWSVQKSRTRIWSLLLYYSLSQKYDLIFYAENERWSFTKEYMKIWYFLQMPWKDGLSWNKIFLVLSGKTAFFPENQIFFLWKENEQ